ncbi:MAG TPA: class 1 fructose-bisphosphatase [Candidatus Binatia bacterium]|nr:class 1 fructose-bisphosphatase [Candidatus Binatia bacterium]
MSTTGITLTRYLLMQQQAHPGATGEFSLLLSQIALAAKVIACELSRAGLADVLGATGEINVQGEATQKLDTIANTAFLQAFEYGQLVSEVVSEEMEQPAPIQGNENKGKYVIFVDPLDGSSNLDVNVTVGSIFSVHRRPAGHTADLSRDLHLPGRQQVAAGYALYGPSTILVYTTGNGVHGFTLDPALGEFLLSHENIHTPVRGSTYSINEGRRQEWYPATRGYIDYLQQSDKASGRPYSGRYVGSLVADFHRTLLKGGIFLYPADPKNTNGKLRLMYEASPLALVAEQAGGCASTGTQQILDIIPASLHQRVPLLLGSAEDVTRAESFYRETAVSRG